jgi:MoaA/NifB/PqqE/SkfB family radical SAM enzyme
MATSDSQGPSLYELMHDGLIASAKPKEAWLALTGRCNLACLHCPRDAETASNENLAEDALEKVFNEIFPHLETVLLGGNNLAEQFISREVERVVEEAVRKGIKIAITTNASVVRPALIEKLVAAGAEFRLSMEGTEESWEKVRGARWSTFQKFLGELNHARMAKDGGCNVTIGFTAFANNIEQLPAVIRFAKEMNASKVHVQNLLPVHPNQRLQSLSYHRLLANRIFDEAEILAKDLGIVLELPSHFPIGKMEKCDEPQTNQKHAKLVPCYYPWTAANVLENGDVTPCCISNTMIMGNLKKQSFDEIWNGKAYQRVRATVNKKPYGACRNCAMRKGSNNDPAALLKLIEGDNLASFATQTLKNFLVRRLHKTTIKRLIRVRDGSIRFWNVYRGNPFLLISNISKLSKSSGRRMKKSTKTDESDSGSTIS